jgi:hypothetical protein
LAVLGFIGTASFFDEAEEKVHDYPKDGDDPVSLQPHVPVL